MSFVSLDGVDWNDPDKQKKLYVGRAILDYFATFGAKSKKSEFEEAFRLDTHTITGVFLFGKQLPQYVWPSLGDRQ